jgi:hypothetical protein
LSTKVCTRLPGPRPDHAHICLPTTSLHTAIVRPDHGNASVGRRQSARDALARNGGRARRQTNVCWSAFTSHTLADGPARAASARTLSRPGRSGMSRSTASQLRQAPPSPSPTAPGAFGTPRAFSLPHPPFALTPCGTCCRTFSVYWALAACAPARDALVNVHNAHFPSAGPTPCPCASEPTSTSAASLSASLARRRIGMLELRAGWVERADTVRCANMRCRVARYCKRTVLYADAVHNGTGRAYNADGGTWTTRAAMQLAGSPTAGVDMCA